jgi:hypothetical protein
LKSFLTNLAPLTDFIFYVMPQTIIMIY